MCGAFGLIADIELLKKRFGLEKANVLVPHKYNIRPGSSIPVVLDEAPTELSLAVWGIVPFWDKTGKKQIINARADSLEKPTFKKSLEEKRCLILADGFYEWQKVPGEKHKVPYRFTLNSDGPFAFAGIWDEEQGLPHCAIITTEPNELVAEAHDRMPAILSPEAEQDWLSPDLSPEQARELLEPYPSSQMKATVISSLINSPGFDGPEIITPA